MVTIPPALRPPVKPLTQAQKQAIQTPTPTTIQVLTPEQQAQVQEHEKVLSQVTSDLQKAQAELQFVNAEFESLKQQALSADVSVHPRTIDSYLKQRSAAESAIRNLQQAQSIARGHIVSYQELKGYVSELERVERQETSFQKAQAFSAKQKQEFAIKYGVPYSRKAVMEVQARATGIRPPALKTSGGRGHSTVQDLVDYEIALAKYESRKPDIKFIGEGVETRGYDIPVRKISELPPPPEFSSQKLFLEPSISPYQETTPFQLSLFEAGEMSARRVGGDIKTFFLPRKTDVVSRYGYEYVPEKQFYGIGGYLDPFKYVGKTEREKAEARGKQYTGVLKIGTISPEEEAPFLTFDEFTAPQKAKYIDLEKYLKYDAEMGIAVIGQDFSKEFSDKLSSKYQTQVSKGKITVEESNKLLSEETSSEATQKKFQSEYDKKVRRYLEAKKLQGSLIRTGAGVEPALKTGIELASFLHPASAVGMGLYKFSKAEQEGLVFLDKDKQLPVYYDVKVPLGKKIEASAYLIGGGLGAFGMLRATEKAIVTEELKQLAKQPTVFKGIQVTGREPEEVLVRGVKTFRKLKTEADIYGKVYSIGEKEFIMPSAFGEARTYGELSWNILGGARPTYITAVQQFGVEAGGISIPISESGKLFGTIGVSKITPTEATGLIYQTKPIPKPYLKFPSPKIRPTFKKEAKFLARELVKGYEVGGVISKEITTSKTLVLPKDWMITTTTKKDIGIMKRLFLPKDTGLGFITKADIKKTPISQIYAEEQVVSAVFKSPIERMVKAPVEKAIKIVSKEVVPPTISRITFVVTPIVERLEFGRIASLGIQETRFKTGILGVERRAIVEKVIEREEEALKPISVLSSELISKPVEIEKVREGLAITPRLSQKELQKLKQEQALTTLTIIPTAPVTPPIVPPVPPPTLVPFAFWFPEEEAKPIIGKGYYPEAYIDSTKRKKAHWQRLSEKPMSEQTAMSVSSEFVDKQISSRGRAVPSKKKKEKIIHTGEDYFGVNKRKFRTWKQTKKKRTPLPKNNFIELQRFRSDRIGEKIALQKGRKKRRTPFGF